MNLRLTALFCLLFSSVILLSSCEKELEKQQIFTVNAPMTPGQVIVPGTITLPASNASGNIRGNYDRESRLFTYTLTWSGLAGNASAIHLHGLADQGKIALPAPLGPYTNGIIQSFTSGFPAQPAGTYNGTLYIDGNIIKEEMLLNGQMYFDIHSAAVPFSTTGELRGQVKFD